jgi:3-oxoadipate enol-lactonase
VSKLRNKKEVIGEIKMKKTILVFCILVFTTTNLFSQELASDSSLTIDSGYINVDGGKLYYEVTGEGDWIVLLHDGILHHVIWDGQFKLLAKHYKVVRYDRRGFGKSSQPEAPFSHTDDLNQLFTQLKIPSAIVFGMSAGGALAINFTLDYPNKVKGLVLVGAVVAGFSFSNHVLTRGGRIDLNEIFKDQEKFIQYFAWDDPYEIYPKNIEAKKKFLEILKANPQNITGASGYFSKPLQRADVKFLNEIKVPTLILVGEYDIPDVHAVSGALQSGIPNSKRKIISNSGHLIPLEQPEAFNAAVLKFLNSLGFYKVLNSAGVEAAVQYFQKKHETEPDVVFFDEGEMNLIGYNYLQSGNIKDAIEIFKLNTIAYPDSWNVYDSLGEAYLKDGQTELAIENYKKSLKLNPNNTNAIEVLKNLKESK